MSGTPTHHIWNGIKTRCLDKNCRTYKTYGGRGISICDRWLTFELFLADMGEKPDGMTIDRINPNGDYEPSNCRWVDMKTQQNNRTNNRKITARGRTQNLQQWADEVGIDRSAIAARIDRLGWSPEDAIFRPLFSD